MHVTHKIPTTTAGSGQLNYQTIMGPATQGGQIAKNSQSNLQLANTLQASSSK